MRCFGLFLAAIAVLGCQEPQPFECERDKQCRTSAEEGVCEADGYCSFAEAGCISGRRYADLAPDEVAGRCVPAAMTEPPDPSEPGTDDPVPSADPPPPEPPTCEAAAWPIAECEACVAAHCCDALTDCSNDPLCACHLECPAGTDCGCGPSIFWAVELCVGVACGSDC